MSGCTAPRSSGENVANSDGMNRDNELGDYLRARREALTPAQAGLPDGGDRRVYGLRREEVALLAGVSTDYLTRLEQGRERSPSVQVLDAIALALQLDVHAATHLVRLGQPTSRAAVASWRPTVSPELLDLMQRLVGVPACVVGPALDLLALNEQAEALYRGFAYRDNLMRMIFLDPVARDFYQDWDRTARGVVRNFRATSAAFADDLRVREVVGELALRSPAFAALWAEYEVRPRTLEDKAFHHPDVGDLYLHFQAFTVTDAPGQQLFDYTADPGSPSVDALTLLSQHTTWAGSAPHAGAATRDGAASGRVDFDGERP